MVNGDDICWVFILLGFDNYLDVMIKFFYKYREYERDKVSSYGKGEKSLSNEEREYYDD